MTTPTTPTSSERPTWVSTLSPLDRALLQAGNAYRIYAEQRRAA